jgi:hypothetical protein
MNGAVDSMVLVKGLWEDFVDKHGWDRKVCGVCGVTMSDKLAFVRPRIKLR